MKLNSILDVKKVVEKLANRKLKMVKNTKLKSPYQKVPVSGKMDSIDFNGAYTLEDTEVLLLVFIA